MGTYRWSGERERSLVRCAVCDATGKVAGGGWVDANTVCGSCGMTQVASPFEGSDYFDVIMKSSRPIWRGARLRRAG